VGLASEQAHDPVGDSRVGERLEEGERVVVGGLHDSIYIESM
jgi:hypothetical protein